RTVRAVLASAAAGAGSASAAPQSTSIIGIIRRARFRFIGPPAIYRRRSSPLWCRCRRSASRQSWRHEMNTFPQMISSQGLRDEMLAADRAEEEIGIDAHGEIEACIAMPKVLEHGGVGRAGLEVGAEVVAGHHRDCSHSRAYSGKRFFNCACISLRALKR